MAQIGLGHLEEQGLGVLGLGGLFAVPRLRLAQLALRRFQLRRRRLARARQCVRTSTERRGTQGTKGGELRHKGVTKDGPCGSGVTSASTGGLSRARYRTSKRVARSAFWVSAVARSRPSLASVCITSASA